VIFNLIVLFVICCDCDKMNQCFIDFLGGTFEDR
jgi:hypothetical protein